MSRLFAILVLVLGFAGCSVNSSPIYLYMTTGEMQRAIDARYCAGMTADQAIAQAKADGQEYFVTGDESVELVEVRVMPAGLIRQTEPEFGRLMLSFTGGELASVEYGSPIDGGSDWEYTAYKLTECTSEPPAVESEVSP